MQLFYFFTFFSISFAKLITNGTYNSFIQQIGYCKMQSFNTISRSSSNSVPMFLDGRIDIGVGLSDENMKLTDANLCGMCINITNVDNFYHWNFDLTEWNYSILNHHFLIGMIFDRCPDAICIKNFLDFDIYNPLQPVSHGNPTNIEWYSIPCPISNNEFIEYLICTDITCNQQNINFPSLNQLLQSSFYFWTISFRNMRFPIKFVSIFYQNKNYILSKENSWTWNFDSYFLGSGINITFIDINNKLFNDYIDLSKSYLSNHYHGALIYHSKLQN